MRREKDGAVGGEVRVECGEERRGERGVLGLRKR